MLRIVHFFFSPHGCNLHKYLLFIVFPLNVGNKTSFKCSRTAPEQRNVMWSAAQFETHTTLCELAECAISGLLPFSGRKKSRRPLVNQALGFSSPLKPMR